MPDISTATNRHYDARKADWTLAQAFYAGDGVEQYLTRAAFEAKDAFKERRKRSDWRPYTRDVVSRLTGALFQHYSEVERTLGPIPAAWLDASGPAAESYRLQLMQLATWLLIYSEAWVLVDGTRLVILDPLQVPRWTADQVVVKGKETLPTSILEAEETRKTWTVYGPSGWTRYSVDDEGEASVTATGVYHDDALPYLDRSGRPTPPLVHVQMPWDVAFGTQLARAHRAIYQTESDLDSMLRNASHALLQIGTDLVSEADEGSGIIGLVGQALQKGGRAIPYNKDFGRHEFINPSSENGALAAQRLEEKVDGFYDTAFQSIEQAVQTSATEAIIDHATGTGAALTVLAGALESAEQSLLPLVAQSFDMTVEPPFDTSAEWPDNLSQTQVDIRPAAE